MEEQTELVTPRRDFLTAGMRKWIILGVAVLVVAIAAGTIAGIVAARRASGTAVSTEPESSAAPRVKVGSPAPDITLQRLTGGNMRLSSLRGQVVLVNLWATWCTPCVKEMPDLEALYQEQRDRGLVVVGINAKEDGELLVTPFVRRLQVTFPILLDPQGDALRTYFVTALPSSFFIDREGVLRDMNIGLMSKETMERRVLRLLDTAAQ